MTLRRPSSGRPSQKLKRGYFLRHYEHYSHETWHDAMLWHDASKYTILSDFHPRSWPQGLMHKSEKNQKLTFSQTL